MTRIVLWGSRGSLAAPGAETARYGGNTSCVAVQGAAGTLLVLDAGTGVRRLGASVGATLARIDILLTHLHLDHIQGLAFFAPLYDPGVEVHVWGPASTSYDLRTRLIRYFSPPLFPVHLRDIPGLVLHDLPAEDFDVGEFRVSSARICHPGLTVGYRITAATRVLSYLPDHEPALGVAGFPQEADWTSGAALAEGADLLIHDAQYSRVEYDDHIGWGHSAIDHTLAFATLADVQHLVTFHHDPARDDDALDRLLAEACGAAGPHFKVTAGTEGATFELSLGDPRAPRAHRRESFE